MTNFKRTFLFILFSLLIASNLWAQKKEIVSITQGELAKSIGEKIGYTADHTANLKKIGVTPLGEWNPEKGLTKDDFEAVLIRIARRSPIVENREPSKILDSMGFPPRDTAREGVEKVLESKAFRRAVINSKLILCQPLLPLPPIYQAVAVVLKDVTQELVAIAVATPVSAVATTRAGGEEADGGGEEEDGGGDEPPISPPLPPPVDPSHP